MNVIIFYFIVIFSAVNPDFLIFVLHKSFLHLELAEDLANCRIILVFATFLKSSEAAWLLQRNCTIFRESIHLSQDSSGLALPMVEFPRKISENQENVQLFQKIAMLILYQLCIRFLKIKYGVEGREIEVSYFAPLAVQIWILLLLPLCLLIPFNKPFAQMLFVRNVFY